MSIYDKCYDFTRADEAKEKGVYPYFHPLEENEGPVVTINGKELIMAGSNNYLGLTSHEHVKKAAKEAINKYGTGCSGSRYLTGTLDLHIELEKRLAKFIGVESVLLFSTGYQSLIGVIPTIVGRGDYIISDKENHASIINGSLMARSFGARFLRYKHGDIEDLERVIADVPIDANKLIISDGVFSVTGEIVELPEIRQIAKKYNSEILIDDAHAIGVIGKGGRGSHSHYNLEPGNDMIVGTFSKTFASLGGFIAGPERVINYIKHFSAAMIFSASPTPSSCAASLAALDILEQQPGLVDKLKEVADYMRKGFNDIGLNIVDGQTAIVPVIVGEVDLAMLSWRKLFDAGVYVNAFIPPGVPPDMSMLRTSFMATHEKHHLDEILNRFENTSKELKLL